MGANPALDFVRAVAATDSLDAARPIIDSTTLPLDANFYEKLFWQLHQWSGDAARAGRRAFDRLWEYRFRRTDVDHWATPQAQAFVREMIADPSATAVQQFAQQHQDQFSPNVVEAICAAEYFADVAQAETRQALMTVAGAASNALGMRLTHFPPILYRTVLVPGLLDSFAARQMLSVLDQLPLALPLAFTVAGMLDDMHADTTLGSDATTTRFVYFVDGLAKHLAERDGEPRDMGIYLYEVLLALYDAAGQDEAYANTLANLEESRAARAGLDT